ncbi:MAG: hypothetical protein M3418_03415, partial [Gemmatimonadota bacterium]|nr:hypothetical protein [Gemmatimonadota bacterium]
MLTRREMLARLAGVSAVLLLEGCNSLSDLPTAPTYYAASLLSTGTTYYVDPAGDDENSGSSPEEAWSSLARVVAAGLQPGDVVLLAAGATHAVGAWFSPSSLQSTATE